MTSKMRNHHNLTIDLCKYSNRKCLFLQWAFDENIYIPLYELFKEHGKITRMDTCELAHCAFIFFEDEETANIVLNLPHVQNTNFINISYLVNLDIKTTQLLQSRKKLYWEIDRPIDFRCALLLPDYKTESDYIFEEIVQSRLPQFNIYDFYVDPLVAVTKYNKETEAKEYFCNLKSIIEFVSIEKNNKILFQLKDFHTELSINISTLEVEISNYLFKSHSSNLDIDAKRKTLVNRMLQIDVIAKLINTLERDFMKLKSIIKINVDANYIKSIHGNEEHRQSTLSDQSQNNTLFKFDPPNSTPNYTHMIQPVLNNPHMVYSTCPSQILDENNVQIVPLNRLYSFSNSHVATPILNNQFQPARSSCDMLSMELDNVNVSRYEIQNANIKENITPSWISNDGKWSKPASRSASFSQEGISSNLNANAAPFTPSSMMLNNNSSNFTSDTSSNILNSNSTDDEIEELNKTNQYTNHEITNFIEENFNFKEEYEKSAHRNKKYEFTFDPFDIDIQYTFRDVNFDNNSNMKDNKYEIDRKHIRNNCAGDVYLIDMHFEHKKENLIDYHSNSNDFFKISDLKKKSFDYLTLSQILNSRVFDA